MQGLQRVFLDLQGSIEVGDRSLNEVPYTSANCAPCGFALVKGRKPDTPIMRHGVHDT